MDLILASASPRRRELLGRIGVEFIVAPCASEESSPPGLDPEDAVIHLALEKAVSISYMHPASIVLGADTAVVAGPDGSAVWLGKPSSPIEAEEMLAQLSGRVHRVVTGVAVVHQSAGEADGILEARCEATTSIVEFRCLSDDEITGYVASGEPMDKAGAYAIQGGAASFVKRVVGDYYNIVGLGLESVSRLLKGLMHIPFAPPPPPPTLFPILPGGDLRSYQHRGAPEELLARR